MKKLGALLCAIPLFAACAVPDGDERETSAAALAPSDCLPETLIPRATGARRRILERAAAWVDDPVPYSMEEWKDGYRQDCSGFVGLAWAVSSAMTTASLPPRDDDSSYAKRIAWEAMLPGDAINRPPTTFSSVGHVRLYAGQSANGRACFWEQTQGFFSSGTQVHVYSKESTESDGFVPIRKKGL